ncbi:MAG: GNAT family N-acetyltransferase [Streptosporangiaceae bacterium]|nr:GNAT family N-acetyltransferase [Streptosporangiaceae bacterium]
MRIERVDPADTDAVRACHQAYLAAQRADEPEPWMGERRFGGWLAVGWIGDPGEVWLAADEPGADVAGWYRIELPDRENRDRAPLELMVRPEQRRRGYGRALLRHAAVRAAAHGRSVLSAPARNGGDGEAFALAAGSKPELVDVQRVLDLAALPAGRVAELRGQAERAAAGYSLRSWAGPVPDDLLEQAAAMYNALSDAPRGPGTEPEAWDAHRVRERINDILPRFGMRAHSVAARHDASGELAALTTLAVEEADPVWGHQFVTVVARKHRGHRLGLLAKTAMLDLIAAAEPQVKRVVTWNAHDNTHMTAVNEALGYVPSGQPGTWWQLDVAAVSAA